MNLSTRSQRHWMRLRRSSKKPTAKSATSSEAKIRCAQGSRCVAAPCFHSCAMSTRLTHISQSIISKKRRLTNKQYIILARGGAKSMYASCIQSYYLNVDTSTTHQITTAPTMRQADEVMSPQRTAITRAKGPLFKFLTEGSLQKIKRFYCSNSLLFKMISARYLL